MSTQLTRFKEGGIKELWHISMPLMISTLASLLMIFTDRIFLARYSIDALNASVNAGTLAWAFMAGVGMVTAMSEIFVAQYNGAAIFKKIGPAVWQMLWVAILSFALFIPLGIFGSEIFFSSSHLQSLETSYFRWLMFFGPSYAIMMALSGFFIGRGKTKIMIWLAVVANCINIVLDKALIFGIEGFIPEMGIQGAAIATCFGYLFESIVLVYIFFKKENREKFATSEWKLQPTEMKKSLKVGIPQGIFCSLEIVGWAIFYWMMTELSPEHITVSSICQSFLILLSFFCDGLSRGASAVTGNLIGSKKNHLVSKTLRSGLVLMSVFFLVSSLIFLIAPIDTVKALFVQDINDAMQQSIKTCMGCVFIYLYFDGIRWLLSGILVAAGDTLFLLLAGSVSVWIFLLIPIYLIVVQNNLSVEYAWALTVLYSFIFLTIYWKRFKKGSWQNVDLIQSNHYSTDSLNNQSPT